MKIWVLFMMFFGMPALGSELPERIVFELVQMTEDRLLTSSSTLLLDQGQFDSLKGDDLIDSFAVCGPDADYYCFVSSVFDFAHPKEYKRVWDFDGYRYEVVDNIVWRDRYIENDMEVIVQTRDGEYQKTFFVVDAHSIIGFTFDADYLAKDAMRLMTQHNKPLDLSVVHLVSEKHQLSNVLDSRRVQLLEMNALKNDDTYSSHRRSDCLARNQCPE